MTEPRRYRRLVDLMLGGRRRVADEMDVELESHLAMRTADLIRAGRDPAEAHREARRRFGDYEQARRRLHAAAQRRDAALKQRDVVGSLIADVRYAARQIRRHSSFAALAIATLAVGIGSATTLFTLVNHVLLQPLPFPNAEQLIAVTARDSAHDVLPTISSADWLDWRRATTLQGLALHRYPLRQSLVTSDSSVRVAAEQVSSNFFDVLRPPMRAGRAFREDDDSNGTSSVVISERLWREMFSADARLTEPLRTSARSYRVVGVIRAGAEFPAGTDVWFPVHFTLATDPSRINVNWLPIARLRPGATPAQAAAELSGIARQIHASDPTALYDFGAGAQPLRDAIVGDASLYLKLLMAVVLLVLLIVCANVTATGLARSASRAREMAIRTSLGARRSRIVQQLLVEHAALGIVAGVVGLALSWAALRLIVARWGAEIPRAGEVAMDVSVFAFTFALSVGAGVLAGTLPALSGTRQSPRAMIAAGGRSAANGGRHLAGAWLVASEIALAVLLLTGAGLLIRSFTSVLGRGLGFDTNVATAEVTLPSRLRNDPDQTRAIWKSLLQQYRGIPTAVGVAVANWIPLGITGQSFIEIADHDTYNAGAVYRAVSADFFRTLSIPVLVGRTFDANDRFGSPRVVIVNHQMATKYWPSEDPIGKRVRATSIEGVRDGQPAEWLTVVGVVGDIRTYGLETDARPEMYVVYDQTPQPSIGMTLLVRGEGPARRLFGEMRRRARVVDRSLAVDTGTLEERLDATLASRVLTMSLLSSFAALALFLAALGVYAILTYSVAQRARELAVRAALGARRGQLLLLVLRAGLRVVAIGVVVGVIASVVLTRTIESLLVGVVPVDAVSLGSAVTLLTLVSLGAILVPAYRATRLDPLIALQSE